MAARPKGYGMTAELRDKTDQKYNSETEEDVMTWISAVTGETISERGVTQVHEVLKDGRILCMLINALSPGSVKKVNESKMAFKQMENIGKFLDACYAYGCNKQDMFQTVDLYEAQNMPQVLNGVMALGRRAQTQGYSGPVLGPKESTTNKREFTEDQLRAGDGIIGLQAGSNKGASQAGQNFGKSRSIMD